MMPLAAGGMARIYIGRTTGIGSFERHVVLKLILPEKANDVTAVHMFLDEARLAAALNHQNVAQVFEVGEDGGIHYLAMEYVHGQDLRALLAKAGSEGSRVPLELALTVVVGAAAGLNHAHERRGPDGVPLGIVHRDVSPSNIMIGYDGAVKMLDFGIAKASQRSVETQSGIIKGKFAYMAPEQCRGRDVDRRSDVFSLGIILYEISTQHRCFRADSDFDTMHRIVTGDVVRPTRLVQGYPEALEAIVMKALAVDPNQRYQSAGALLEAIEGFAVSNRMSLSTSALGRFMREMFGEMPEPWLSRQTPNPVQPRESTISNTNGTGREPVPPAALELPKIHKDEPPPPSPEDWNAKSYPAMQPSFASPETMAPDVMLARPPSQPNISPTRPDPSVVARPSLPQMIPATGPQMIAATPPAGIAVPLPSAAQPIVQPLPFQTPPSGSGQAMESIATLTGRADSFQQEPSVLVLKPQRRGLMIGAAVGGLVLIAILATALSGGGDKKIDGPVDEPAVAELPLDAAPMPIDSTVVAVVQRPIDAAVAMVAPPPVVPIDAPPPAPVEELVAIHVAATPAGSDVIIDGEFIGTAPVDIKRKKSGKRAQLLVRHKGYDDTKATLDLSGDATKSVTLTKKPDDRPPEQKRPNNPPPPTQKKCQQAGQYNPYDPRPVCK